MTGSAPSLDDTARHEITELYARYSYAYDEARPDELAGLFTADGAFLREGARPVRGSAALADMVRSAAHHSPGIRHLVSNILLRQTAEGATGTAYVAALRITPEGLRVLAVGRYEDDFARTTQGWRFRSRRFSPFSPDVPVSGTEKLDTTQTTVR
ncbi:nuclear transport factor 2 family protein [Streptomyces acidicola]|uniref:nuclear transport factor 2 family protein n=1 Tax=Streptomyces acidicola TaxID=2596892 RepID=UPI0038058DF4